MEQQECIDSEWQHKFFASRSQQQNPVPRGAIKRLSLWSYIVVLLLVSPCSLEICLISCLLACLLALFYMLGGQGAYHHGLDSFVPKRTDTAKLRNVHHQDPLICVVLSKRGSHLGSPLKEAPEKGSLISRTTLVVQYLGGLKVNLWDYKGILLPQKG